MARVDGKLSCLCARLHDNMVSNFSAINYSVYSTVKFYQLSVKEEKMSMTAVFSTICFILVTERNMNEDMTTIWFGFFVALIIL